MSINSILEKRNKFQQTVENTSNFDFEFYGIEDVLHRDITTKSRGRFLYHVIYRNDRK